MEVIPKIIHYCWFGKGKKSKLVNNCIKSWKHFLPDYEIKCWDETNTCFDVPYIIQAYKLQEWAFVSDYVRLKVLNDYGGIYFDTDVLVVKNFDALLRNSCFFGVEEKKIIGTAIIASVKGHPFINYCLDDYISLKKIELNNIKEFISPKIITRCFKDYYNFNKDFTNQLNFKDITIYSKELFYPMPLTDRYNKHYERFIFEDTYAIHFWDASWVVFPAFKLIREKQYYSGVKKMFKEVLQNKNISVAYFRKIASSFKQSIKNKK